MRVSNEDIPVVSPERGMYLIYDIVAESFIGTVILEKHPAPACRLFAQLLGDKNTQLFAHPKDYNLIHVGYIADSGAITPIVIQTVMTGESWVSLNEKSQTELAFGDA